MNVLPGQTCFEVPEVEVAVHIPEDQGVAFPGNACNTTHAALSERRRNHTTVVQSAANNTLTITTSTKVHEECLGRKKVSGLLLRQGLWR